MIKKKTTRLEMQYDRQVLTAWIAGVNMNTYIKPP